MDVCAYGKLVEIIPCLLNHRIPLPRHNLLFSEGCAYNDAETAIRTIKRMAHFFDFPMLVSVFIAVDVTFYHVSYLPSIKYAKQNNNDIVISKIY